MDVTLSRQFGTFGCSFPGECVIVDHEEFGDFWVKNLWLYVANYDADTTLYIVCSTPYDPVYFVQAWNAIAGIPDSVQWFDTAVHCTSDLILVGSTEDAYSVHNLVTISTSSPNMSQVELVGKYPEQSLYVGSVVLAIAVFFGIIFYFKNR